MAGTSQNFDAAAFRQAIRSTMTMAMPNNVAERATFRWKPLATYASQDPGGDPYDWTAAPTSEVDHPDVQVPVAIEFASSASEGTFVGEFDPGRIVITVLDDDYAQIRGANQVVIDGDVYDIDFTAPPMGLFDVTVYTLYATTADET